MTPVINLLFFAFFLSCFVSFGSLIAALVAAHLVVDGSIPFAVLSSLVKFSWVSLVCSASLLFPVSVVIVAAAAAAANPDDNDRGIRPTR